MVRNSTSLDQLLFALPLRVSLIKEHRHWGGRSVCNSCSGGLSRRHTIAGALSVLTSLSLISPTVASEGQQGCWLRAANETGGPGEPLISSGISEIDAFCARESDQLNNLFGVAPALRYFSGSDSGNAFATKEAIDPAHPTGTILIGTKLAEELLTAYKTISTLPLAAVMAHEWGHIVQYSRSYQSEWDVQYELSADAGAGWYLLKTRGYDALVPHTEALGSYYETLGTRRFNNFRYHGTPTQRKNELLNAAGLIESVTGLQDKLDMTAASVLGIE